MVLPEQQRIDASAAAATPADAIAAYVSGAVAAFGIEPADRVALWADRLRSTAPELARLAQADGPSESVPVGLPARTRMARPAGETDRRGRLAALVQEIATGRADPVARVQRALETIAARASLNAMRHVDAEGALRQARDLRERMRRGEPPGRLAGVLVAVKDCFAVAGLPSTCGTRALSAEVAARSAPSVERLQQQGAIIVGMTTMHELAYGATTDNPHFGRVHHADDPARLVGGSSGGSAVAVACGMADVALGTDTAGSVRMPAALCGISGFKPSYGVVPMGGVLPLAWSLDHVGTLAGSALDHALLVEVMAGLEEGTLQAAAPEPLRAVAPSNYFLEFVEPEVKRLYLGALEKLEYAGVALQREPLEGLELAPTLQSFTIAAEAAAVHVDRALRNPDGLGEEVRARLESGQFVRAVDYLKAQRLRSELSRQLLAPFTRGAHVLVTPAVIVPAPAPGSTVEAGGTRLPIHPALTRCTLPFNLTGMPAITVPCGRTRDGMPVGLQLAAARGDDARLLAIASRLEPILAG